MNGINPRGVVKTRRRVSRPGAFTLIEILVATFIFSIVLASLFGTWKVIARSTDSAIRIAAESQRTRLGLQCIESAFSSIQMFQGNPKWYSFDVDTSGNYAEVSFAASLGDSFPGSGFFDGQRQRRITFRVEPSPDGGNDLVMHQLPLLYPLASDLDTHPLILAKDVSRFQLRFWDKRRNELVEDWLTTNQLPMLVEVVIGFGTENRMSRRSAQVISRSIRLPDSPVPSALQGTGAPQGGGR